MNLDALILALADAPDFETAKTALLRACTGLLEAEHQTLKLEIDAPHPGQNVEPPEAKRARLEAFEARLATMQAKLREIQ